ncbi:hypothetical protein ANCCAN_00474 [Ancylostoma caninum]|uniref:Sulfatase N-terminal domain-containing protein n=1 Tax=Ancylostoma caninum TaxID=29170 RepID=A0A368HCP3_ANCCA|nr:hypothetical protein ANCCAN_00474 [Ancylostoma caninum]
MLHMSKIMFGVERLFFRLYTPNIRSLAFHQNSVQLTNSYVNQLCTPTRSAFMTGYYPFRVGTQSRANCASIPNQNRKEGIAQCGEKVEKPESQHLDSKNKPGNRI